MPADDAEIDVAMAITRHRETGKVLIIKKASDYRSHERYAKTPWEVPGGKIEEQDRADTATMDDAATHAARRELEEETQITGDIVETADPYRTEQPGKTITFYPVLLETTEASVRLSRSHEHVDYRWIHVTEVDEFLTEHEEEAFDRLDL